MEEIIIDDSMDAQTILNIVEAELERKYRIKMEDKQNGINNG